MRIIAGTARSLPLKTIEGKDTRPTTDKTKETLFNVMQFDVPGAYFLDLFAGSGQIGLEALSRGAAYAVFVENSRKAASCIEDNIHFTKCIRARVYIRPGCTGIVCFIFHIKYCRFVNRWLLYLRLCRMCHGNDTGSSDSGTGSSNVSRCMFRIYHSISADKAWN